MAALRSAGLGRVARDVSAFTRQYTDPGRDEYRRRVMAAATAEDGEIEVDSDAAISDSDDYGEYLLCWVWVPDPDPEDDPEED